ncbi:hypothetical protein H4S07_000787 [Coemansia furcata]|uniref:Uncharacterized protein n=1 Tax=Coemansia furcata TaxID=417177 RepID=A0ACC1LQA4_9FUNG|nr:hypothetical protein H4S07_000787 [Coemansia furcata]
MNFDSRTGEQQQQQPTLEQLDGWCEQALSSASPEIRSEAERRLRYYFPTFSETLAEVSESHGFSSGQARVMAVFHSIKGPAESAKLMTWFLHQSSKVFSITYVVNRLRTLVLNHLNVMDDDQKTELRNLFTAIQDKFVELPGFLIDDLTRTLALVVMFTWFDLPDSKGVVDSILEMGSTSDKHEILALQMMRSFVEEFNKELPPKYISKQRRVVVTFRDKQLKSIFEHALRAMRSAIGGGGSDKRVMLSQALLVQRDCLGFDFIGLAPDEASDEAVAIQIPSTWKDLIQVEGFLDPYFEGYAHCGPPLSSQFVEVLVLVASIRRSFYMEAIRINFVKRMSAGIAEILAGAVGLDDVENYHHVCRLLARFRCIHTLVEIEDSPVYRTLLVAAAGFTVTGLGLWEWSSNSIAPLLTFWAKVAVAHDGRDSSNSEICGDVIAATLPRVVGEHLRAMVQATARVASGESLADSPLENTDALLENMALAANIARASYEACGAAVLAMTREMAGEYQALLNGGQASAEAVAACEAQLAWPVYAVAQCIGARQPYKSQAEDDQADAEMFAVALELDHVVRQRLQRGVGGDPCEALELAFLHLHHNFRATYIGEQGYKATAVYSKLAALVGLRDSSHVLDLMLDKLLFNLRTWPPTSPVVHRSLQLFHDLSVGYVSVRQVAKLDSVKALLVGHSGEGFRFLGAIDEYKPRALYYAGLARILFSAADATLSAFAEFMRPWGQLIDELMAMSDAQLAMDHVRPGLIRVLRDLRGFLSAVSSKSNYTMFFDWMCTTQRMRLVHRCVEMRADVKVQIAALKFMAEFVFNRTQRLNFDVASPNGILIFREASRAMWAYGSRILEERNIVRDVYKERYKGVAVCFTILARLVAGKYVAIGVMPLYGDTALERAYRVSVELLKQFPVPDVIAYPKLGKATTSLLEVLLSKPNIDLVPLDDAAYEHVMRVCVEAFDHAETAVSSSACGVIDGVLTAAIEHEGSDVANLVRARSADITTYLLRTMLNIVLFEDRPNDWSFSRPLFCLILLDTQFALQYTSQIVQYQPAERREDLIKALKELLSSTEFVLTTTNRDRFTQALTQYRREVAAKNLILMVPTSQTLGAPVDILSHSAENTAGAIAQDEGEAAMVD